MKIRHRLLLRALIIIVLLFTGSLLLNNYKTVSASVLSYSNSSQVVNQSQEVVIRLYYENQEQLNAVAGQIDIWEVHPQADGSYGSGYAVAAVIPAKQEWLIANGYHVELDPEKTALLQAPAAPLDPQYYYFDDFVYNPNNRYMVDFVESINSTYPDLTELIDVGDAWLASHGGYARNIWVLRISNEDPQYGVIATKPKFFMMANIHAREVTTPEMAIRYIKYLTGGYNGEGGYGTDPDVTWLVNHHATYVMLTINPDGRVKNEQSTSNNWRKNMDNDDGCGSSFGVDLNRNSNFYWGWDDDGSSPYPCNETYRGPSAGSEPETTAFQSFAASIFQDQNGNNGDYTIVRAPDNASGIFLTLHSYADDILWPFGFSPGSAPNDAQLETIARKLADITGVMAPTGGIGYSVNGSSDDWVYGKLGVAAFTYEIGPDYGTCGGFFPAYNCQEGIGGAPRNFWGEMKESFIYINKIAATPYITTYGPDSQNLSALPQDNPTLFDLTGTVLDQRYGGDPLQPVTAAEYFIDAPGADGTGIAMSPADGSWGSNSENVVAVVDASGLSQGRHYVLVHGKNDDNLWGPFTAVFMNVSTPTYGVTLTPDSDEAQADPGQTVTYHMQIHNIGLNSDSYELSLADQWPYTMTSTIGPLDPGESAAFDVEISIPEGAINGESDIATLMAISQADGEVSDSSILNTTANYYDLALTPGTAEANGYAGGQVDYVLQITNLGNIPDTFDISATGDWAVTAPPVIGPIESGQWADAQISVSVPLSAMPGDFDTATITATSQADGSKSQIATLTTTAVQAGPVVNPATNEGSGNPGASVLYTLQLTNHNYLPDTFTLDASSGWAMDFPATVGPIPANGSTDIQVSVDIPAYADGGAMDTAVLTITSSIPDLPSATATLMTSANKVYSFTAVPVENPLTAYGTGITVQYTLLVTNNGNVTDSYNFYVISSEWQVDVPAYVGPITRGESTSVTVTVHVPLGIAMGDSNDATLAVISQGRSNGHQVHLHTDTFWYSTFMPLSQKH